MFGVCATPSIILKINLLFFKGASKGHPSLLNTIGPSPHHGSLGHVDVTLYLMNQGPFCEALSSAPENCSGNVALILKFYSSCLSKLETFFTMLNESTSIVFPLFYLY